MLNENDLKARTGLTIVYDKECPFCRNFVELYRLKNEVGDVHLIDARSEHGLTNELSEQGKDLNDGMMVYWKGQSYYAADAINIMAIVSSSNSVWGKLYRFVFSKRLLASMLYPVLVFLRKLLLLIMGRKPIK